MNCVYFRTTLNSVLDNSRYPTTKRLTNADVDAEIKKALDVWAEYTDLNFEMKTTGQVKKVDVF
jgi:hypothetical protein